MIRDMITDTDVDTDMDMDTVLVVFCMRLKNMIHDVMLSWLALAS